MKTNLLSASDRVSESTHYEAYFDLYGFPLAWIEAISEGLHKYCEPSLGDECESYTCSACMAVRFTSTDAKRTQEAKRIFSRLFNLASKTLSDRRHYELVCG